MNRRAVGLIVSGLVAIAAGIVCVAIAFTRPVEVAPLPPPDPMYAPPAPVTASAVGYTVTLYPVLADTSRVLVTYTLTAAPGHYAEAIFLANGISPYSELLGPSLNEKDDTPVPARSQWVQAWTFDQPTGTATPTAASVVTRALAFDRVDLPNAQDVLSLRLTGDLIAVKSRDYSDVVFLDPITETVARGLSFNFEIPLDRSWRTVNVDQTVSAGGISLTLERVAATRTETVFSMRGHREPGSASDSFTGDLTPTGMTVQIGNDEAAKPNGDYPLGGYHLQHTRTGNQWRVHYPGDLYDSNEQVTLRFDEVIIAQPHTDTAQSNKGPWKFQFTLGPPTTDTAPLAGP